MSTHDLLGDATAEASEEDEEFNGEGSPPASPEGDGEDLQDSSGEKQLRLPAVSRTVYSLFHFARPWMCMHWEELRLRHAPLSYAVKACQQQQQQCEWQPICS